MKPLGTVTNKINISNLNKFFKMSLDDFEKNEEKYKKELLDINYKCILLIKKEKSLLNIELTVDELIKISKFSNYFFGRISIQKQKGLLKEYSEIPREKLLERYPLGYILYLEARIFSRDALDSILKKLKDENLIS